MKKAAVILFIFFLLPILVLGQKSFQPASELLPRNVETKKDSTKTKDCEQKEIGDLFRKKNKPPREPKKFSFLILPNISSNPANGFLLGVGGNLAWYLGSMKSTRISLIGFSAAVTTKKQFISFIKTNIYTKENLFFLQGDWRYYHYSLPTYGLGTNTPPDSVNYNGHWIWLGADTQATNGGYPMRYDYLKFHEVVNRKITDNLYAGVGYALDYFWNIKDELLYLDTIPRQITPHYTYSKRNSFDTTNYVLSGFSLNLMYDSRDNMINPYKGYYAIINYRINQTWLGSDQNASSLWLEFRTYVGLSKKRPRHLVAFWVFGDFQITGDRPYMTLMAIGEDQKGRSGRGYIAGRYRGESLVYGEVEYRFPILMCSQIVGGVVFANATTTTNLAVGTQLFDYVRPGIGFGLRFMINKHTRLNINIDFAMGYKSKGFYFSGTETF